MNGSGQLPKPPKMASLVRGPNPKLCSDVLDISYGIKNHSLGNLVPKEKDDAALFTAQSTHIGIFSVCVWLSLPPNTMGTINRACLLSLDEALGTSHLAVNMHQSCETGGGPTRCVCD